MHVDPAGGERRLVGPLEVLAEEPEVRGPGPLGVFVDLEQEGGSGQPRQSSEMSLVSEIKVPSEAKT